MYADTKSRIKFSDGVSKPFLSKRGVKQGDVLRPMLFNIFINNIVGKLDCSDADPVLVGEVSQLFAICRRSCTFIR